MSDKITLKSARVNAGYTQEEVAKLMGVSKPTVVKWEKDDTGKDITIKNLERLCNLYKRKIGDIFFKN